MTATETLTLICEPGAIVCPRCENLLPRQHTGPGWRFDFCERKRPIGTAPDGRIRVGRCNTHLWISRGRGEQHVIVAALASEADKARLIEVLERSDAAASPAA